LRLVGLMTIGAAGGGEEDFAALRGARERLVNVLPDDGVWGEEDAGAGAGAGAGADVEVDGLGEGEEEGASGGRGTGRGSGRRRILLSMGMSNDFELAVRAGADVVRVGMGIFGARPPKKELEGASAAEQA
jgi:hypothetical protein